MKKLVLFLAFILFLGININAQSKEVTLIMCERYTNDGPVGVGSVFTKGYLTVVAMSKSSMKYKEVYIQFDKMDKSGQYKFYKRFPFDFPYGYKTVYFSRIANNDMEFEHIGYYMVYLLDKYKNVIASTFVRIVD
jgi:hypothetical protein